MSEMNFAEVRKEYVRAKVTCKIKEGLREGKII
jgi:hypothetical protein